MRPWGGSPSPVAAWIRAQLGAKQQGRTRRASPARLVSVASLQPAAASGVHARLGPPSPFLCFALKHTHCVSLPQQTGRAPAQPPRALACKLWLCQDLFATHACKLASARATLCAYPELANAGLTGQPHGCLAGRRLPPFRLGAAGADSPLAHAARSPPAPLSPFHGPPRKRSLARSLLNTASGRGPGLNDTRAPGAAATRACSP
jgi:hypothetical protein